jgi:hypothetical protein
MARRAQSVGSLVERDPITDARRAWSVAAGIAAGGSMKTAITLAAVLFTGAVAAEDANPYFDVPLATVQAFALRESFKLESHTRDPADDNHLYKYVYKAGDLKQVILITATDEKEPRVSLVAYAWWLSADRGTIILVATTFMKLVNEIGTGRDWSLAESARFLARVLDQVATSSLPFLETSGRLQFMGMHTQGATILFMVPDDGTDLPDPGNQLTLLQVAPRGPRQR